MTARFPLLLLLAVTPARAADSVQVPAGPTLVQDPLLRGLVKEAMEKRPELAQVRAQIRAEQERVPQSRVLPDPTLLLGLQNDGFSSIQIGKMETSFVTIMASQTFPWPGKRVLRGEVAALEHGRPKSTSDACFSRSRQTWSARMSTCSSCAINFACSQGWNRSGHNRRR